MHVRRLPPSITLVLTVFYNLTVFYKSGQSPMHALLVGVNFIESHFLIPLVNRRSVELSPAVTLISLVALGTLFGFLGMLLATPLAAAFLVLVRRDYVEGVLERRNSVRQAHGPA